MSQHEDIFRRELVDELRRVENLVRHEPSPEKKIYYFSAAYGITGRTYRYAFSKDVLVADLLLQNSYNMLKERLEQLRGGSGNVPLDPAIFDKICDGIIQLAERFESRESILEPLENIISAAFAVTGPGNYLREKGELKI